MEAAMLDALRAIVGPTDLLVDPELTVSYGIDWTGRFQGRPGAVVRPADPTQVAAVGTVCAQDDIALVPQGGDTGLVGGGAPRGGEVVLSLHRLADVTDVDPLGGQLPAGAGATIA